MNQLKDYGEFLSRQIATAFPTVDNSTPVKSVIRNGVANRPLIVNAEELPTIRIKDANETEYVVGLSAAHNYLFVITILGYPPAGDDPVVFTVWNRND